MGYRHIDTAQAYGNERGVGEGVRNCGIPREEMFVVSKVAAEHKTYEEAMEGINETLEKIWRYLGILRKQRAMVKVEFFRYTAERCRR